MYALPIRAIHRSTLPASRNFPSGTTRASRVVQQQQVKYFSASSSPRAPAGLDSQTIMMGTLSALTGCLCAWQLTRYQWKVDLLATRKAALTSAPLDLSRGPLVLEGTGADRAGESSKGVLTPVQLEGVTLDPEYASSPVQLTPRTAPENLPPYLSRLTTAHAGRQVVVPLIRRDGSRVMGILGWVPSDIPVPSPLALPHPTGVIQGVLRHTDTRKVLGVPGSGEEGGKVGVYAFLDTQALARHFGLKEERGDVMDAVVELVAPFPPSPPPSTSTSPSSSTPPLTLSPLWPVTRQWEQLHSASLAPPHTHLVYAATWFALAIFGGVSTYGRARGGGAGRGVRKFV
jgi:cytochrome oxidase assembly protein ShyY1